MILNIFLSQRLLEKSCLWENQPVRLEKTLYFLIFLLSKSAIKICQEHQMIDFYTSEISPHVVDSVHI